MDTVNNWLTNLTSIVGSYASIQAPKQPAAVPYTLPSATTFGLSTTEIVVAVLGVVVAAVVIKKLI